MIGLVNYGGGNLGSVKNALDRLGVRAQFIRDPEEITGHWYTKILFPGDGHFGTTMTSLERSGHGAALAEWIRQDRPFLGICIGLQVLFPMSEEAPGSRGLSALPGAVRRFPGRKVPQIGWNQTRAHPGSRLFRGIPENSFFYYIHSYYVVCDDEGAVAAQSEYYLPYCAAIERGNCAAVQFHPEKSGVLGLKLLENWALA